MFRDQKRKLRDLSRAEHGIAVIRRKIDRPMPFLQFGFACDCQDLLVDLSVIASAECQMTK